MTTMTTTTLRFEWSDSIDHRDYFRDPAGHRERIARRDQEPGYQDYVETRRAHALCDTGHGYQLRRVGYTFADIDNATVRAYALVTDDRSITTAGQDSTHKVREVTIEPRWVVVAPCKSAPAGEAVLTGIGSGTPTTYATEAAAAKQLAKWKKSAAAWHADRAALDAVRDQVNAAFHAGSIPSNLWGPTTSTKVGDWVRVRGHNALRRGIVIEATATRVRVAYTTRANLAQGGTPYAKWVKRSPEA